MGRRAKRWAVIVGCLLGGIIVLVFCGPFALAWVADRVGPPFSYPFDDRAFDQRTWLQSSGDDRDSPRGRMTADLIANHLKPGMHKAEVKRLLGKPDYQEKPDTYSPVPPHGKNDVIWCYGIGWWSGFRMDGDVLAIHFDGAGRLVEAWHYQM